MRLNKQRSKLIAFVFTIIFVSLITFFIISEIMPSDRMPSDRIPSDRIPSDQIHIIGDAGWTEFKNDGNCSGSGTVYDPYVIMGLYIENDDPLYTKYCIWIENSTIHFLIIDCFLFTPFRWPEYRIGSGIKLTDVANFQLIDNICQHNGVGIYLDNCNYGNIVGNHLFLNDRGLFIDYSREINVMDNILEKNSGWIGTAGFLLESSINIIVAGNFMLECGISLSGSIEQLNSYNIKTNNRVNGKPLYYYKNQNNLGPNNFANAGQVIMSNCSNSLISNLNVSLCEGGIALHYCNNNTITSNIAGGGYYPYTYASCAIYLHGSNNNNITGNSVEFGRNGMSIYRSDFNFISENKISHNSRGIRLNRAKNNTLLSNNVSESAEGIYLYLSNSTIISENYVFNNTDGIYIEEASNNIVSENTLCNNYYNGIALIKCNISSVINNSVMGSSSQGSGQQGIRLSQCIEIIVTGNNLDTCGIRLDGSIEELTSHEIETTNLINGKIFYYYCFKDNLKPVNFTNAGQIIMVECNDSLITNVITSFCYRGITLYYCNNNSISACKLTDQNIGICLEFSNHNNIRGNDFENNSKGIYFYKCDNNDVIGNTITSATIGIYFSNSNDNNISDNILIDNQDCFYEYESFGNFFENNTCT